MAETAIAQLFDRLRRLALASEAENVRLRDGHRLAEERITQLRDENERLRRDLSAERAERAELVDQVIDWLGQGEEIVRAGVANVGSAPLAPAQPMRTAIKTDLAEALGGMRERMDQRDFDRTFGTGDGPG